MSTVAPRHPDHAYPIGHLEDRIVTLHFPSPSEECLPYQTRGSPGQGVGLPHQTRAYFQQSLSSPSQQDFPKATGYVPPITFGILSGWELTPLSDHRSLWIYLPYDRGFSEDC